jgi:hypothetical protein
MVANRALEFFEFRATFFDGRIRRRAIAFALFLEDGFDIEVAGRGSFGNHRKLQA